MFTFDFLLFLCAICLIALVVWRQRQASTLSSLPLPPGPKKLPLLGNMLDLPKRLEWVTYHNWCKGFESDIIHLNVAGTSIVILDTYEAAWELFEKRSSIYSGRARMPMVTELMGWDFNTGFMDYGDLWRAHRKLLHHAFHPTAQRMFHPHVQKATHGFLRRLIDDHKDENILDILKQFAAEIAFSVTYGLDVKPQNDPYVDMAEEGIRALLSAGMPGRFLVNTFPILKHIPEWMPGAGFKQKAKEWYKQTRVMLETPYEDAKLKMESGIDTVSFMSFSLKNMEESSSGNCNEEAVKGVSGTLYAALSDTTTSTIASCILGLLENPRVLKKAQQEIDSILKPGHMVNLDDEPSLPYITAIVKESLRWRAVTPLGGPRRILVDDEYNGYRIPAGSIVIANVWAMLHDEEVYPEPLSFNPDRFMKDGKLNKDVKDPACAAFGFGRRICPGRYLARSSLWIAVASLISAFDISKALDENGMTVEPSHEYISAITLYPLPFKCSIKPRSQALEALIRSAASE